MFTLKITNLKVFLKKLPKKLKIMFFVLKYIYNFLFFVRYLHILYKYSMDLYIKIIAIILLPCLSNYCFRLIFCSSMRSIILFSTTYQHETYKLKRTFLYTQLRSSVDLSIK